MRTLIGLLASVWLAGISPSVGRRALAPTNSSWSDGSHSGDVVLPHHARSRHLAPLAALAAPVILPAPQLRLLAVERAAPAARPLRHSSSLGARAPPA